MVQQLTRGLVDLSSVLWTGLLSGKDVEFGKKVISEAGKEVHVNSATHGYENAMDYLMQFMKDCNLTPHQLIFVVEGRGSKGMRQAIFEGYKAGRDKVPEQYEAFNKAKEMLLDAFLAVGAQACQQDGGVEADDVIAYLAQNLEGIRWICSSDKDLCQLVGPGPRDRLNIYGKVAASIAGRKGLDDSAWTGFVHHYRNGTVDVNSFGPFSHHLVPVAIALVGDSADKIPGARGFGPKAFEDLLVAFGGDEGLQSMDVLIRKRRLLELQDDVAELKSLQKVIDFAPDVYLSYELGRLYPHKVNTMRRPLEWRVGMVRERTAETDMRLRKWAGATRIVSAENYSEILPWARQMIEASPFVALDIETSTPPQSDDWLEAMDKTEDRKPVDVFGSDLTSLQLTFGPNLQYTVYLPVDNVEEPDCTNLTVDQVRRFVEMVPKTTYTYIQNCSFELPVLYNTWGKEWANDPDWRGFVPNALDTKIGSSYVDENFSSGLKDISKRLLGYNQVSYQEVTTKEMTRAEYEARPASSMDQRGRVLATWFQQVPSGDVGECGEPIMVDGPEMVRVQFKMNQMTASEVLDYGADDTICTAAAANHFRTVMELENTWHIYLEVEQLPAYLTAKAFNDGVDFSLQDMREMEKDDDQAYDAAWATLRAFLIKVGFDGVNPPVYSELTPANIKEAFQIVTGHKLDTLVRMVPKLCKFIEQQADDGAYGDQEDLARMFVVALAEQDLDKFNAFVASKFDGEPKIDLGSSKQMTRLLYDVMGLPVRIVNPPTETERERKPELASAVQRFSRKRAGHADVFLSDEDMKLVRLKAKADDTAIDTALAFDTDVIDDEARAALKAIGTMKKVMTRRNLFFKTYWTARHWKDGKVHPSVNQCGTVTRRYSASNPNITQLPKLGDGARFRNNFKPHTSDGFVCSADYSGQELRVSAHISKDSNLLSCYVGNNLKDVHSITAAGAMEIKWGRERVAELVGKYGQGLDISTEDGQYELFSRVRALGKDDPDGKLADDLRKVAKNVNFGSIYLAKAPKLADTLIMSLEDATIFLDARNERFSGLNDAAARSEQECLERGHSLTLMGARRHLASKISSDDRGEAARAARQSWNFEVQGSAAEMTKLGLARLWKSGAPWSLNMRFMFPVHDELVWSVSADDLVESLRVVHDCMTQPYADMTVPILSSLSFGRDYGQQSECGDWFDEDQVRKVLSKYVTTDEKEAA